MGSREQKLTTAPSISGEQRWPLTVVTALIGWTLANMDQSFFTFAYPYIQHEFGITLSQVSYLYVIIFVTGWLATVAIGPIVDYWGRKGAFQQTMLIRKVYLHFLQIVGITSAGSSSENFTSHIMVKSVPGHRKGMMVDLAQCGYHIGWFSRQDCLFS